MYITLDGTDVTQHTIYVDGVINNGSSSSEPMRTNTTDNPLLFGRDPVHGRNYKGYMDEVMIFDRALSASEIRYYAERGYE
jgi:hypothetical protein